MEFEILRQNMARRAKAVENLPRLQQRRLEVQRGDAVLLAWQNRERSVLSKKLVHQLPAGHQLRTFDPESLANRALVAQQASVLATAARRRARARLYAADNTNSAAASATELDPITGVIQRASLTGGRLHARDLASQSARSDAEHDDEPDPVKWLFSAVTSSTIVPPLELATSPAVKTRVGRARSARMSGNDIEPLWVEQSDVTTPTKKPPVTPRSPRSLSEIRASRDAVTPSRPDALAAQDLDPLTDALHTASMLGIAPPPPPGDWRTVDADPVTVSRDAPERVRRARSDHEARLGVVAKSPAGKTPEPAVLEPTRPTAKRRLTSPLPAAGGSSASSSGMLNLHVLSADNVSQQATKRTLSTTESDGSSSGKDQASPPSGSPERVSPVSADLPSPTLPPLDTGTAHVATIAMD